MSKHRPEPVLLSINLTLYFNSEFSLFFRIRLSITLTLHPHFDDIINVLEEGRVGCEGTIGQKHVLVCRNLTLNTI